MSDIINIINDNWAKLATSVIVAGWFITSYLNRRNELFKENLKERLARRREMFDVVIETFSDYKNGRPSPNGKNPYGKEGDLSSMMYYCHNKVYLYGYPKEILIFNKFYEKFEKSQFSREEKWVEIDKLIETFRYYLRKDLALKEK